MKKIISLLSMIGLLSISPHAVAVDLFQTGETLTADKLNDIDHRILALEQRIMALEKTYVIGHTGPAGGIVFYTLGLGHHGLEAATIDQAIPLNPGAEWGCTGTAVAGAFGIAIGTGAQNTAVILAGCSTAGIAARLADNFTLNGYNDWFLPSRDELHELYLNRVGVAGFTSGAYWSSSQVSATFAQYVVFASGNQFVATKNNPFGVRAVRAF